MQILNRKPTPSKLALIALTALWLAAPSFAQPIEPRATEPSVKPMSKVVEAGIERRLPESTQILVQAPSCLKTYQWIERFVDTPIGDRVMQELVNEYGDLPVLLRRDVLPYLDGRLNLALVRVGSESSLESYGKYSERADVYRGLHRQVGFLGKEVAAFKAKFKRLPKNWDEMVQKKIRKTVPRPEMAYCDFVIVEGDGDWKVTVVYRESASTIDLQSLGEPPSYSGKRGLTRLSLPKPKVHLAMALESSNPSKISSALNSSTAQKLGITSIDATHWTVESDWCAPFKIDLKKNLFVVSDDDEILANLADGSVAQKRLASLQDNRRYQQQIAQLGQPTSKDFLLFVDLKDLLTTTPSRGAFLKEIETMESLGMAFRMSYQGNAVFPYQMSGHSFLQIGDQAVVPSNLAAASGWDFVANLPANSSITTGWQVQENARLAKVLSAWYPSLSDIEPVFQGTLRETLGTDVKGQELLSNLNWVAAENEFFSAALQSFLWSTFIGGDSDSKALQSLVGVVSLELADAKASSATADQMAKQIPSLGSAVSVGPNRYWLSSDNTLGVVQLAERLVIGSRANKRLLFRNLAAQARQALRISEEPHWKEFIGSVSGRPLFFLHEKIDGPYSLLKGLLLTVDSETRPEAETFGSYRDCYVAGTVEPNGLHLFSGIYSAKEPLTLASATPNKQLDAIIESLSQAFQSPVPVQKRKQKR